jgi:hypothetical protein
VQNAETANDQEDETDLLLHLMEGYRKRPMDGKVRAEQNKRLKVDLFERHQESRGRASTLVANTGAGISAFNGARIYRTRDLRIIQKPEHKLYSFWFDKRIMLLDFNTVPFGYCK